jgi:hypothetical protein
VKIGNDNSYCLEKVEVRLAAMKEVRDLLASRIILISYHVRAKFLLCLFLVYLLRYLPKDLFLLLAAKGYLYSAELRCGCLYCFL